MKSGFYVVGLALLLGVTLGLVVYREYRQSAGAINDLFVGLAYYIEENDGRFPSSAEAFLAAPFVEGTIDELRILPRETSLLPRKPSGTPIRKLDAYQLPWGVDMTGLRFDPERIVRNAKGHEVLLLGEGTSIPGRRWFSQDLLRFWQDATGATTTAPTTRAASP